MKLIDFHYDLPVEAIAQDPVDPRDHSRLLVLDRQSKSLEHRHFYDVVDYLKAGDILVVNATKVFPARLRGKKKTGGKAEVLLIAPFGQAKSSNVERLLACPKDATWRALVRGVNGPTVLEFPGDLSAQVLERLENGEWLLQFSNPDLRAYLQDHGEMPLPPYIKRPAPRPSDLNRYQTVYAEKEGAVAAPTAGFHFTPSLLQKIRSKGVSVLSIVLHVGWGTFRPVRTENVEDHPMLPETYDVSEDVARELTQAKQKGRRIVAVGTTAVRTLETVCDESGVFHAGRGSSALFIYPGYIFKAVSALITNFHLPDSTPLLLASAFFGGKPDRPFSLRAAYQEAIRVGYRFYSYGDAMFIQ